jgi:hypothetical protein
MPPSATGITSSLLLAKGRVEVGQGTKLGREEAGIVITVVVVGSGNIGLPPGNSLMDDHP